MQTLPINQIKILKRYRKDVGDITLLADSIKTIGLLHPVCVDSDNNLIAGERRLEAFKMLGKDTIPATVLPMSDIVLGEYAENEVRKDFNHSERVAIGEAVELSLGNRQGQRTDIKLVQNFAQVKGKKTSQIAAKKAGYKNKETYRQAKKVINEAAPELTKAMDDGRIAPSIASNLTELPDSKQILLASKGKEKEAIQAAKEIRAGKAEKNRKERINKIHKISQGNTKLNTEKTYPVIYADPPWRYEHSVSISRDIENQYPTMALQEICELPVGKLSTQDSILFLWATSPKLEESMQVIKSWGFNYRTCAVWDKQKKGMGYYFRQQHELLLVATKGNIPPPKVSNRERSVFSVPYEGHSVKPDLFYKLIENMYPDFSKIELFARNKRDGWNNWGNQSNAA